MIRPSALRSVAVAAIATAALLGACGSSDDASDSTSASAGTAAGAATTAAADSGGLYGGGDTETTAAAAQAGGTDEVTIADFAFDPSDLEVTKGTTVTWTNTDGTKHRIKADDDSFTSDSLSEDDTFEHTFDTAGTFAYICSIHPSMKGTITVS